MSVQLGIIRKCAKRDLDPKRPGHKICLYTQTVKPRRVLGRHRTRASAQNQERVIEAKKHGWKPTGKKKKSRPKKRKR